ncbi:C21orf33 [Blepharisma stoltei]|uniref:Uncharacterized protein n=1 Tax=Blepharisma stoltei TaxID=1481888 RepID=A0AAU9KC96_9CILI|nr:unnamed protein product [Blepharisma stoltei]
MISRLYRGFSTKKVAVVLSGCGVYDGSEITESVAVLANLSKNGAEYQCFAPDKPQFHIVNHLSGEEVQNQQRNVLQESARIARGNVLALSSLRPANFDALILPGGFGAAKNLSTFATQGANMTVDPDLTQAILGFFQLNKPMGFTCISPIICAKILGTKNKKPGIELTLGKRRKDETWPFSGSIEVADSFGNKLVDKDVDEIMVDSSALIVSTPAYMKSTAKPHEVYEGIGKLVKKVLDLTVKNADD